MVGWKLHCRRVDRWIHDSYRKCLSCEIILSFVLNLENHQFVKVKTRSTYDKTNSVINTLIRHVVETAAITAVAAGVDIVLFITSRNQTQGYTDP